MELQVISIDSLFEMGMDWFSVEQILEVEGNGESGEGQLLGDRIGGEDGENVEVDGNRMWLKRKSSREEVAMSMRLPVSGEGQGMIGSERSSVSGCWCIWGKGMKERSCWSKWKGHSRMRQPNKGKPRCTYGRRGEGACNQPTKRRGTVSFCDREKYQSSRDVNSVAMTIGQAEVREAWYRGQDFSVTYQ